MSVSARNIEITEIYAKLYSSDYTIVDDKDLERYDGNVFGGHKIIYHNGNLFRLEPQLGYLHFILREDVDYEEANKRIIEIFKEFYPDNYLGVSEPTTSTEYDEYADNYKPNLWSNTVDGVTIYTVCVSDNMVCDINDEKVTAAKKYSKAFMKKLYEEKLISEFYDFGEIYLSDELDNRMYYLANEDIDLIKNYIKKNNIDCTFEKDDNFYELKSNDGDLLKTFLIAADIYEATSIRIIPLNVLEEGGSPLMFYGKNAVEDLWSTGDANGDGDITIRDCLFIARKLVHREGAYLANSADYNKDGKKNIKDAADLAKDIAKRII